MKSVFYLFILFFACIPRINATSYEVFQLESKIELYIKDLISTHISPEEYMVIVNIDPKYIEEHMAKKNGEEKKTNLPYNTLQINPDILQESFNAPDKAFSVPLKIQLLFDDTVPKEKQKAIEDKIKKALDINDKERTLSASATKLLHEKVVETKSVGGENGGGGDKDTLKMEMEASKLENERIKLANEREKADSSRKNGDLEDKLKEIEKKLADQQEQDANKEKPKTSLELLSQFQLTILGVILAIALLLLVIIGSSSVRKGSTILSDGLAKLGESLKGGAAGGGGSGGGGGGGIGGGGIGGEDSRTNIESNAQSLTIGSVNNAGNEVIDEKTEQFLVLLGEKVEVLSTEGNFNFYRNFLDLVEENIAYATAILVSLKGVHGQKLISHLPTESIEKIQNFLAEPDGVRLAKSMRRNALENFYGKICMDEFMNSPLLEVKDISWLTTLSTIELRDLSLLLEKEDRTAFFACFTPTRLSLILEKATDEPMKEKIIDSLVMLDQVQVKDVPGMFKKIQETYEKQKKEEIEKIRRIVDAPRYVAKVITGVGVENRERLLNKLSQRADLMAAIRNYYIPFETLSKVSQKIVADIFAKRPTSQVALAMFNASKEVRDVIVKVIPEMLQESLKEELDSLIEDKSSEKKNKVQSEKIQEEVCRYLLMLNKDGLLEYTEKAAS